MVNITSTSMDLRRATAACGIAACALVMFFGLQQIVGLFLAPATVVVLSIVFVMLFCLTCLLGATAQFIEGMRLVLLMQPTKLFWFSASQISFFVGPNSPPPRFAS